MNNVYKYLLLMMVGVAYVGMPNGVFAAAANLSVEDPVEVEQGPEEAGQLVPRSALSVDPGTKIMALPVDPNDRAVLQRLSREERRDMRPRGTERTIAEEQQSMRKRPKTEAEREAQAAEEVKELAQLGQEQLSQEESAKLARVFTQKKWKAIESLMKRTEFLLDLLLTALNSTNDRAGRRNLRKMIQNTIYYALGDTPIKADDSHLLSNINKAIDKPILEYEFAQLLRLLHDGKLEEALDLVKTAHGGSFTLRFIGYDFNIEMYRKEFSRIIATIMYECLFGKGRPFTFLLQEPKGDILAKAKAIWTQEAPDYGRRTTEDYRLVPGLKNPSLEKSAEGTTGQETSDLKQKRLQEIGKAIDALMKPLFVVLQLEHSTGTRRNLRKIINKGIEKMGHGEIALGMSEAALKEALHKPIVEDDYFIRILRYVHDGELERARTLVKSAYGGSYALPSDFMYEDFENEYKETLVEIFYEGLFGQGRPFAFVLKPLVGTLPEDVASIQTSSK
ncbi:MAG TPA: hypothetical protein VGT41_01915 [Candidatus Babeliales bacterium]|nr:hypothetical protein [Candidatus Babeliales bacterium]